MQSCSLLHTMILLFDIAQVKLDPTKGSWKPHEVHATKMIYAARRVAVEAFTTQIGSQFLENAVAENDCDDEVFWLLGVKLEEYMTSLQNAKCEISRFVALYMLYTESWLRCTKGVRIGDWLLLEVECILWGAVWNALGKHNYELEWKRRIEAMYEKLKPVELEYKRRNNFVRMTEGGNFTTHDDLCEKHNHDEKSCPADSNFENVIERSQLLQLIIQCRLEFFGTRKSSSSTLLAGLGWMSNM